MQFSDLKSGDCIWVNHHGSHPAVVLAVREDVIIVVCGTSQRRDYPDELQIPVNSTSGKRLNLTGPTYFSSSKVTTISDPRLLLRKHGRLPINDDFEKLSAMGNDAVKAFQLAEARTLPDNAAPSSASPAGAGQEMPSKQ